MTKPKPQDPAAGTPGQKYEKQLQQVLDDWAEKALEILAEDIRTLDRPESVREIRPQTSERTLRTLRTAAAGAVKDWVQLPSRPKPAEFSLPPPSKESIERAEQRRRIEDGYTYTVDMRRFVNEDRARAGLQPLPEDEALTSDE